MSLCEHVKEHSKEGNNYAIYQHYATKGHPLPNVDQFKVIGQEVFQVAHEAKEAIHIHKLAPELNRNVGKMVIPCVFDPILSVKPKIHTLLQFSHSSQVHKVLVLISHNFTLSLIEELHAQIELIELKISHQISS